MRFIKGITAFSDRPREHVSAGIDGNFVVMHFACPHTLPRSKYKIPYGAARIWKEKKGHAVATDIDSAIALRDILNALFPD